MESQSHNNQPLDEHELFLRNFVCNKCGVSYHDENKPFFLDCCNLQVCQECLPDDSDILEQNPEGIPAVKMCPALGPMHKLGPYHVNYELQSNFESMLNSAKIIKSNVMKTQLKIGMLPEKCILELMQWYIKSGFPKLDIEKRGTRFQLKEDEKSYLKQKYFIIDLRKEYYFSLYYYQLRNKIFSFMNQRQFIFISPKNMNLSAQDQYRNVISQQFDLVLVEINYPLEPNYVIIEDIPEEINPDEFKRLNLAQEQTSANNPNGIQFNIEVNKYKQFEYQRTCHLVIDFKASSQLANQFQRRIQDTGIQVSSNSQDVDQRMIVTAKTHQYYRFMFTARFDRVKRFQPNNYIPSEVEVDRNQQWQSQNQNGFGNSSHKPSSDWGKSPIEQKIDNSSSYLLSEQERTQNNRNPWGNNETQNNISSKYEVEDHRGEERSFIDFSKGRGYRPPQRESQQRDSQFGEQRQRDSKFEEKRKSQEKKVFDSDNRSTFQEEEIKYGNSTSKFQSNTESQKSFGRGSQMSKPSNYSQEQQQQSINDSERSEAPQQSFGRGRGYTSYSQQNQDNEPKPSQERSFGRGKGGSSQYQDDNQQQQKSYGRGRGRGSIEESRDSYQRDNINKWNHSSENDDESSSKMQGQGRGRGQFGRGQGTTGDNGKERKFGRGQR